MKSTTLLVTLASALVSAGLLTGCESEETTAASPGEDPKTLYQLASSLPEYSTLVAAVDKAGLASALDDESASLTVFAPDNDAFAALLSSIGASSLDDLTAEQLRPILLYHVLGTEVDAAAASAAAAGGESITGLGGTIRLSTWGESIQLDGRALVEVPDVLASNGIIHGIDGVILPSIADVVVSSESFSSLEAAILAADADPSQPGLVSALDDDSSTFTVFAPPDEAFAVLVSTLGSNPSTGITALTDVQSYQLLPILKYHVVAGTAVRAAEVAPGTVLTLGGELAADTAGGVTLDGVAVTTADLITSNGVIHVVSGVLMPSITDVVTTAPEFSSLAGAVIAADSAMGTNPKVAPALDAPAATGAYTLFAPDNAAFAALGTPPSGQALTNVLLYHVLNESQSIYAADALGLSSATAFDTLLGSTSGAQIVVSSTSTAVVLDDAGTAVDATVQGANYFTSNGVIHRISKVLIPN